MEALVNTHNQNWLMKFFKDCFFNVQDTYIYGLWIFFKCPKAAETHKDAKNRNYSHFIKKEQGKKQGSNDLCMEPRIQQPMPGLRIPHYNFSSKIIKLSCCFQYLFP